MEPTCNTREQGLNQLGAAYIKIKEGKARGLLLLLEGDELIIQTAGASMVESFRMVSRANHLIGQEMADEMDALVAHYNSK